MTFPPPPPSAPPPAWPPAPGQPPPRKSSPVVPLLIVGAIAVVMLMAGAAAAILIVMMHSGAFSPVPPVRDTPPVTQAPPPESPPEPEAATPEPGRPEAGPAARRARETEAAEAAAQRPDRAATAGRSRGDTPAGEPVERAVRVGGQIRPPTKIRNVQPVYPRIAQSARVQGIVIIEATIGPDGKVAQTRVLRSIPLLDQAALEAVRQWEYEPTLLNGVAVPVIMTVTVNFTLK